MPEDLFAVSVQRTRERDEAIQSRNRWAAVAFVALLVAVLIGSILIWAIYG